MTRKILTRLLILALCLFSSLVAGCATQATRTSLTIELPVMDNLVDFFLAIKESHPDLDITITVTKSRERLDEDDAGLLAYRATHDALSDIVISAHLNKNLSGLSSFADLSGKSYSACYQTSYLNDAVVDGELHYLPFCLSEKGLICNQTLFTEKGWAIPTSYAECETLLQEIARDDSIIPFYDEKDFQTMEYWLASAYSYAEGATYDGHRRLASFDGTSEDAESLSLTRTLALLEEEVRTGCLVEKQLNTSSSLTAGANGNFYTLIKRGCAMAFASGTTWQALKKRGTADEFVMIPFFSADCPEGYVQEQQDLNIGVSQSAMDDPKKCAAIDEIMTYIASREAQETLLELTSGIKSPCYGIMNDSDDGMVAIVNALKSGRITRYVPVQYFNAAAETTLRDYLFTNDDGHLTSADVEASLVSSRRETRQETAMNDLAIANVTADFTLEETKRLLLQSMIARTKTDFAVLPKTVAKDYYGNTHASESLLSPLYQGSLTATNVRSLLNGTAAIEVYEITGAMLLKIMDANTSNLLIEGATIIYSHDKATDSDITSGAVLPDGSALRLDATYTLSTADYAALSPTLGTPVLDGTLSGAFIAYCSSLSTLTPPED